MKIDEAIYIMQEPINQVKDNVRGSRIQHLNIYYGGNFEHHKKNFAKRASYEETKNTFGACFLIYQAQELSKIESNNKNNM